MLITLETRTWRLLLLLMMKMMDNDVNARDRFGSYDKGQFITTQHILRGRCWLTSQGYAPVIYPSDPVTRHLFNTEWMDYTKSSIHINAVSATEWDERGGLCIESTISKGREFWSWLVGLLQINPIVHLLCRCAADSSIDPPSSICCDNWGNTLGWVAIL